MLSVLALGWKGERVSAILRKDQGRDVQISLSISPPPSELRNARVRDGLMERERERELGPRIGYKQALIRLPSLATCCRDKYRDEIYSLYVVW